MFKLHIELEIVRDDYSSIEYVILLEVLVLIENFVDEARILKWLPQRHVTLFITRYLPVLTQQMSVKVNFGLYITIYGILTSGTADLECARRLFEGQLAEQPLVIKCKCRSNFVL